MNESVECYAGSTYPESPRALTWMGERYRVKEILQRRREPAGVGFIVRCSPGDSLFDLMYLMEEDQWQIQPKGCMIIKESPRAKPLTQGE